MAGLKTYRELDVWKTSRALVKEVYETTQSFPKDEMYGLTSQIRRAVVSVAANIAEGCGRKHSKETLQFLHISRGSLFELETELYVAFDLGYIGKERLDKILKQHESCLKLLHGFINYMANPKPNRTNNQQPTTNN
jgi:four helix bundle protein